MNYSKLYNANVYLGTNTLLGQAKQVTLPTVTPVLDEHTALGMLGKLDLPTGQIEKLEMTIVWATFHADAIARAADFFEEKNIIVRGSVETYGPAGRISQVPVKWELRGRWKENPLGDLQPGTNTERSESLSVSYVKITVGERVVLEIDAHANIYNVDGVDKLAEYKKNLGL